MKAEYKLKITPAAAGDLDAIDTYITNTLFAPAAAQDLMADFDKSFHSLCNAPYRCELSRNATLREKGYRKLVVNNYVSLYLVDETKKLVIIARVFYGAMDYERYV